jgi:hypothetical protein
MRVSRKLTVPRLLEGLARQRVSVPATPLTVPSRTADRGTGSVNFPGGTKVSPTVTISHALGVVPDHITVTVEATGASTLPIVGRPLAKDEDSVDLRLFSSENVGASTVTFTWEVIAD